MRNLKAISISIFFLSLFSCMDKKEETYTIMEPEYMSYSELRSSVAVKNSQPIQKVGKIYFKNDLIFVNEYMIGIHIINNEDPTKPEKIKFITIPGNVDIAIKGNVLYADSYVDLVALDIRNTDNIREVKRIENAFPYQVPPFENGNAGPVDEERGIVLSWTRRETTVEIEENQTSYPEYLYYNDIAISQRSFSSTSEATNSSLISGAGTGGSMARFTINANYLYTVDASTLRIFDVKQTDNPILNNEINIGWDIETIFPYNNKLFIGSQTGMLIYSLTNPTEPEHLSTYWHVSSCDPVVVEGNYAYVTLRTGNLCGNGSNLLDVIDISDLYNPLLLKEYAMDEPYGLGIYDSTLFVCDGNSGLKIYNVSDPEAISENMITHYPDINAFDAIPLGEILLVIGTDGLFQYDYSDLNEIKPLSVIPVYSSEE